MRDFIWVVLLGMIVAGPGFDDMAFAQASDGDAVVWDEFYVPAPGYDGILPTQGHYPGITTVTLKSIIKSPICPDTSYFSYQISFPANTGNIKVDNQLREYAYKSFEPHTGKSDDDDKWSVWNLSTSIEHCKDLPYDLHPSYVDSMYVLSQSSKNYLSVLFYAYYSTRFLCEYDAFVFDLTSGRKLNIPDDLLMDPIRNEQDFLNYKRGRFCLKYPELYCCEDDCDGRAFDLPACEGRLVLTKKGITVVCGPGDGGPMSSGTRYVDMPKDELIKLGVKPDFWE